MRFLFIIFLSGCTVHLFESDQHERGRLQAEDTKRKDWTANYCIEKCSPYKAIGYLTGGGGCLCEGVK